MASEAKTASSLDGGNGNTVIGPSTALATRLALLELLTLGSLPAQEGALVTGRPGGEAQHAAARARLMAAGVPASSSITSRAYDAQQQLDSSIARYKSIVHFVGEYNQNRKYLLPKVAAGAEVDALAAPTEERNRDARDEEDEDGILAPQSVAALLLDAEPELKHLEQSLRACEHLGERNVAGPGRLAGESAAHFTQGCICRIQEADTRGITLITIRVRAAASPSGAGKEGYARATGGRRRAGKARRCAHGPVWSTCKCQGACAAF